MWERKTKADKPATHATCQLCGEPATQFKQNTPWPGTSYAHKSYTCDAHASYLDGVPWSKQGDGEWVPATATVRDSGTCAFCPAPYGQCEHTRELAAKFDRWEAQAVRGRLPA